MARPKKEGLDYFPHDTDAVNDEKVEALRMLYGNDGYAFYFILLERIYRTKDGELDVSDAETIQILSKKITVTQEKFTEMLQTAIRRGCFSEQDYNKRNVLTSDGIKKRMQPVIDKRLKMKEKYAPKKVSDAETPQKPDKVKESKGKQSKEDKDITEKVKLLFKEWNIIASQSNLISARELTDERRRKIVTRLRERSFEEWKNIFDLCGRITFLNGVSRDGWQASLDWIIKNSKNGLQVLEGNYKKLLNQFVTKKIAEEIIINKTGGNQGLRKPGEANGDSSEHNLGDKEVDWKV